MTGSALLVGLIGGLRAAPVFITGPLGGVVADRLDRTRLLVSSQAVLAVLCSLFAIGVYTGNVTIHHVVAFALLSGIAQDINATLQQSLVANTVPAEHLMNGFGLHGLAHQSSRLLAPAIGGVLIGAFGVPINLFVQSAAYVLVVLLVIPMRTPYRESLNLDAKVSFTKNFLEGLAYVKGNKRLLFLISLAFIPSFFTQPITTIMPVFVGDVLNQGPQVLGLLLSAFGAGALVASVGIATLGSFRHKGMLAVIALACSTLLTLVFSRVTLLPISIVLLGAVGLAHMAFRLTNNVMVHTVIPDHVRGRVVGLYRVEHGFYSLGALALGTLAEFLGADNAIAVMALGGLGVVAFLGLRFLPLWRTT